MPPGGATFDENMGAVRASADTRAANGCFASGCQIAAGDIGSHFPVRFQKGETHGNSCSEFFSSKAPGV